MGLSFAVVLGAAPGRMAAQSGRLVPAGRAPLALDQIEQLAIDSNPGLRAFRLEVSAARADVRTAALRPNPFASVNADVFRTNRLAFEADSGQYGTSIQIPLEWGNKRTRRIESATATVSLVQLQVADSARRVLAAARQARLGLLAAIARLQIADTIVANYRQLEQLNQSRYEEKQIAGTELVRAQVARSQAEIQRDEAALAVRQAQDALAVLIGRRDRPSLADSLAPAVRPLPALDSLEAVALRDRPDALAARAQRRVADANTRLALANARITPSFGIDVMRQQGTGLFGFSGSIPIPVFNRNQGEREKAGVRVVQADRQLEATELAVRTDVRAARSELETRRATLDRFAAGTEQGILGRTRMIRETAAFAYRRGAISLLELLDAERTFSEISRSYVDALAAYAGGLVLLDAATAADAPRLAGVELETTPR